MPYPGNNHEPAVRHPRRHGSEVDGRDPAVAFTPQHEMSVPHLRHATLQLFAFLLAGEIEGRADPNALRDTKGLLQESLEQNLDLSKAFTEPWNGVWRQAAGYKQRRRRRGHYRPRQLLAT